MKILHYIHGLPSVRNGGLVQYALDLAQGESELGKDVQLLVPSRFNRRLKGRTEIRTGSGGTYRVIILLTHCRLQKAKE